MGTISHFVICCDENGQNLYLYTLDDSHRTGTTKIVQAIKSVEENIEDSKEMKLLDQIMYL